MITQPYFILAIAVTLLIVYFALVRFLMRKRQGRDEKRWDEVDLAELTSALERAWSETLEDAVETLRKACIYISSDGKYHYHEMVWEVVDRCLLAKAIITITKAWAKKSGTSEIVAHLAYIIHRGLTSRTPETVNNFASLLTMMAIVDRPFVECELLPRVFPVSIQK